MNPSNQIAQLSGTIRVPSITLVVIVTILMVFVMMYPPFLSSFSNAFTRDYKLVRLLLEVTILLSMTLYLLSKGEAKIFIVLLAALFLYSMNVMLSNELIENGLSHFNKLVLLMLIPRVLCRKNDLARLSKKIWITFWVYCAIMGAIGCLLLMSGLFAPTVENYGNDAGHEYYSYPFIGKFVLKGASDLLSLPRYSGFLSEPIEMGFFYAFNIIIAKRLIFDAKKCKLFIILNIIGAISTFSYMMVPFVALLLSLRLRILSRLISSKIGLIILVVTSLMIMTVLLGLASGEIDRLFPSSSMGDRILRYILSIDLIKGQSLSALLFGMGSVPFIEAMGMGASAGIIDLLVSRGIIIMSIWLYLIYTKARSIPGLFILILLYSLTWSYWHFPLFIVGLAIVASLDLSNSREYHRC